MREMKGMGVSAGYGCGRAHVIDPSSPADSGSAPRGPHAESVRLHAAVERFAQSTRERAASAEELLGRNEAAILSTHAAVMTDPRMQEELSRFIDAGEGASGAVLKACEKFASMLEATGDPVAMQRGADIRDAGNGVLAELSPGGIADTESLPPGCVLVVKTLAPSMAIRIRKGDVDAVVTETGGYTSHSAILLRALGIPAVFSAKGAFEAIAEGQLVAVDGSSGTVAVDPEAQPHLAPAKAAAPAPAPSIGAAQVAGANLRANISAPEEAATAMEKGAQGVGLFRTEYLFMGRTVAPREDDQFAAYRMVAASCLGHPAIIRTLDAGGEKSVPYLQGYGPDGVDGPIVRGVSSYLSNKEIARDQLRALLRASAFGNIHVLIPMIDAAEDMVRIRELLRTCMTDLKGLGVPYDEHVPVGAMMETPLAVRNARSIATVCDFFSIGTNDLTSALTDANRDDDPETLRLAICEPHVISAIRGIAEAGKATGIPTGMCGEAASNPVMAPLWIGLGVSSLSMNASALESVRDSLSRWRLHEAGALAQRVLQLESAVAVKAALEKAARTHSQ